MGGFGFALLISIFYAVIGVRVVRDVWQQRKQIFDRNFTPQDRMLVSQASFFLLVPVSVALHELGHAIAIWSMGGAIVDFGFYFFAGFVSYAEPFSPLQQLFVAAAGTIVNIIIGVAVMAFVLLKRPPMRAAINELLIMFAVLQGANALIFYPLLDFATDMNGDWRQMYSGEAGNWRWVVLAVHAGILGIVFLISRQASLRKRLGALTGLPAGVERSLMGGISLPSRQGARRKPASQAGQSVTAVNQPAPGKRLTLVEERFEAVGTRVASGWPDSVHHRLRSTPSASELLMIWSDGITGVVRIAALRALPDGSGEIWGLLFPGGATQGPPILRRRVERWEALPDEDQLTMSLRVAMESIGRWPIPTDATRTTGYPEAQ